MLHNWKKKWSVERIVFLFAGLNILASIGLGVHFNSYFLIWGALVGLMMVIFALTGFCPLTILLKKLGFKSLENQK